MTAYERSDPPGRLVIFGAGGLGREILNMARDVWPESRVLGYVDDDESIEPGTVRSGAPVLGTSAWLDALDEPTAVVVAVMRPAAKERIVERLRRNPLLSFPSLIHPTTRLTRWLTAGEGVVMTEGNCLSIDVTIGDFVLLNGRVNIGHDAVIGDFTSVMPMSAISGCVRIGRGCLIGAHSAILQGLRIGDGATVGMGSALFRSVPDGATFIGNPARRLR